MIRINLLPQKREVHKEASQAWVAVLLGVLFVEAIAIFFFHQTKTAELAKQKQTNGEIQTQINAIRKTVANHDSVKQQLEVFRQREQAIANLQTARSGPTAVLLEVSQVLTQGRGPTVDPDRLAQLRKDNPLAVPNPGWDTRRLWITNYKEVDRVLTVDGLARDGEDVSELARRLSLSSYFDNVRLLPASKYVDQATKVELKKFQLQAKVKY